MPSWLAAAVYAAAATPSVLQAASIFGVCSLLLHLWCWQECCGVFYSCMQCCASKMVRPVLELTKCG
jgi:hypothetical protein